MDQQPPRAAPVIIACTDGPLLVRGEVTLTSATGEVIPRHRRTVALCRCGVSTIKPFCDGTHRLIGFTTGPRDAPAADPGNASSDTGQGRADRRGEADPGGPPPRSDG